MHCGLCVSNLDQVINQKKYFHSLPAPNEDDIKELVKFGGRDYESMKSFLHRYCGNSPAIAIRSLFLAKNRVVEEDLLIDSVLFDDERLYPLNCKICMEPLTFEETFLSSCGHYYHISCLKMHIVSCMDDGEFSVFPCPQKYIHPKCGRDITVNELRVILGEEDLNRSDKLF